MKKSVAAAALTLILTTHFCINALCQTPEWADAATRKLKFRDSEFILGYASEVNTQKEVPADLLKRVERYAKSQLAEYIQVTVKSEVENIVTENKQGYQQSFTGTYSSSTELNLVGLKVESVYDQKSKTGYALALAKRSELYTYYKALADKSLSDAEIKVKTARESMGSGKGEQALKLSHEAMALIQQIEQAQTVIIAIKRGVTDEVKEQQTRLVALKTSVEDITRNVQRSAGNSLDDICFFLAQGLKMQSGTLDAFVSLANFTYQDTKMGSEFSNRLNQSLTSKLVTDGGYRIVPQGPEKKGYILTGTYWKEAKDLKLIATLRQIDGNVVASAEAFLSLSWIENNQVKYLPENFEDAYSRMKAFNKDEVIKGDLNIEIWTNKGAENLLYTEGEKLKIYIRANKECYVRMIYHLADGQSVLLLDNFYVAGHLINKVIEIPDEFTCAEPFGVETLQVNAQTEKFPNLNTKNEDGYQFIQNTFNDIMVNTRGFKKDTPQIVDKAEKRVVFTTMKK
jgi:hypothetical protein